MNLQIVVITHSYQDRKGVRYMTKGLKVYYLPIRTFYNQCILPTMMCNIPLLRYILLRERIQIVHGHSAFSALAHEAMFVGKLLGLKVGKKKNKTKLKLSTTFIKKIYLGCVHRPQFIWFR